MFRGASAIILYNKDKKILLQHRTDDAPYAPRKWGFFGGRIEKGETPKEAVVRECFEELNYKLKSPKLIYEKVVYGVLKQHIFIEKYDGKQKLILNEGKGMGWFDFNEIDNLDIISFVKKIIRKTKETINNQP
jgi:mutator protein MutT